MNPWDAFAAHPVWAVAAIGAAGWAVARLVVAVGQAVAIARRKGGEP